jgi:hypothetical protein
MLFGSLEFPIRCMNASSFSGFGGDSSKEYAPTFEMFVALRTGFSSRSRSSIDFGWTNTLISVEFRIFSSSIRSGGTTLLPSREMMMLVSRRTRNHNTMDLDSIYFNRWA